MHKDKKWQEKARNLFVDGLRLPTIKAISSPLGQEGSVYVAPQAAYIYFNYL